MHHFILIILTLQTLSVNNPLSIVITLHLRFKEINIVSDKRLGCTLAA